MSGAGEAAPPVPPLLPGEPPLAILVDYDGTIALTDVSDTVMAEHVPAIWETEVAAYDAGLMGSRRLMELEMALIDAPSADLLATAAAQPHDTGFVPFVRRAQAAGIPVEIVSDGFGFFIEPALEALGVGELPVITARTTFDGRRASIAFPNGHPACLVCGTCKRNRVLAHQARRPGRGVHRRRRERPLRGRLQRRRLGETVAGADLRRGRVGVPPLDGVPRDRRVARGGPDRLAGGSILHGGTSCAAVLLWPGSVGPRAGRPAARDVAPASGGRQAVIDRNERRDIDGLGIVEGPQDDRRAGVLAVEDLQVDVGVLERRVRLTEFSSYPHGAGGRPAR